MPLILGVLREPSKTSLDCVAAAAGCLKIVASRSPAAIELYEAEVTLSNTLKLIMKDTLEVVSTTEHSHVQQCAASQQIMCILKLGLAV
jgi:hypothetical protein